MITSTNNMSIRTTKQGSRLRKFFSKPVYDPETGSNSSPFTQTAVGIDSRPRKMWKVLACTTACLMLITLEPAAAAGPKWNRKVMNYDSLKSMKPGDGIYVRYPLRQTTDSQQSDKYGKIVQDPEHGCIEYAKSTFARGYYANEGPDGQRLGMEYSDGLMTYEYKKYGRSNRDSGGDEKCFAYGNDTIRLIKLRASSYSPEKQPEGENAWLNKAENTWVYRAADTAPWDALSHLDSDGCMGEDLPAWLDHLLADREDGQKRHIIHMSENHTYDIDLARLSVTINKNGESHTYEIKNKTEEDNNKAREANQKAQAEKDRKDAEWRKEKFQQAGEFAKQAGEYGKKIAGGLWDYTKMAGSGLSSWWSGDGKTKIDNQTASACVKCNGSGQEPGQFWGTNECSACNGTGTGDGKTKIDAQTASDDKTKIDDQTPSGGKTKIGDKTQSATAPRLEGGLIGDSRDSILCLSRVGDSAETILSRRRRLIGDSRDPPVLRDLMAKIVEANASFRL